MADSAVRVVVAGVAGRMGATLVRLISFPFALVYRLRVEPELAP